MNICLDLPLTSYWPPVDLHFTVGHWGYRPVLLCPDLHGFWRFQLRDSLLYGKLPTVHLSPWYNFPQVKTHNQAAPNRSNSWFQKKKQKQKHNFASRNQRKHGRAAECGCWNFKVRRRLVTVLWWSVLHLPGLGKGHVCQLPLHCYDQNTQQKQLQGERVTLVYGFRDISAHHGREGMALWLCDKGQRSYNGGPGTRGQTLTNTYFC